MVVAEYSWAAGAHQLLGVLRCRELLLAALLGISNPVRLGPAPERLEEREQVKEPKEPPLLLSGAGLRARDLLLWNHGVMQNRLSISVSGAD